MAKILIETTSEFELVDFSQQGLVVQASRPTVSSDDSSFISQRASLRQVKVLGTLSDEATDEEFAKYWDESKTEVKYSENATDEEKAKIDADAKAKQRELAVASFSDAYALRDEAQKVVETVKVDGRKRNQNNGV